MQHSQIEYFVAVAEALSFTRGARRVNIVQSAVSAGIKQLERELCADLFVRHGRRIELTPEGEIFLPKAREILDSVRSARDALDAARGTVRGTVTLGTLAHTGSIDLLKVLQEMRREYPGVVVKLRQTVHGTRTSLEDVRAGVLDLALVSVAGASAPGLDLYELHEEGIVLVCPERHRLAGRKRASLSELADESFIDFPEGWGIRSTVDAAFAAEGQGRSVGTEVVSFSLALELVRQGHGISFLPVSALRDFGREGTWAIPTPLHWRIQLARATSRTSSAAEKALLVSLGQTA